MYRSLKVIGFLCLFASAVATMAAAQTSLDLALGTEYGFGLKANLGPPAVNLEAGAGFVPLLMAWTISMRSNYGVSSDDMKIKFYVPEVVGFKLNISPSGTGREGRVGVKFGATYSSLIKWGYGGGMDYRVNDRITVAGGIMYYPDAFDRLLAKLNEEDHLQLSSDEVSAPLAGVQPFLSVAIALAK